MRFVQRLTTYCLLACTLLLTQTGIAGTYQFGNQIDPHSQIIFSVSHAGFSTSYARFKNFSGNINIVDNDASKSSVELSIDSGSVEFDNEEWNSHIKDTKWLNVAQFPEMTFKSTKITNKEDKAFTITGDLTLLGTTASITLDAKVNKIGEFMGADKAGFSATGVLKRSDFGMKAFLPIIGDDINLIIQVEAIKAKKNGPKK